jgi:predicted NBD/HSP70 family sugar kinase
MRDRTASVRSRTLRLIRERGQVSRGEIGQVFGMDKKGVSLAVERLLDEGLVSVSGHRDSRVGRRSETLSINGAYGVSLGVDIGATHVIGVLSDMAGVVLDRASWDIRPGLPIELILEQMRAISSKLLSSRLVSSKHVSGRSSLPGARGSAVSAGVCVPGFVQPDAGVSLVAENIPGWKNVPVRDVLQRELGIPVSVEDSSRALAAAELWLGAARGVHDFIAVDLGYGIGMGMYCDGSLYRGGSWKAGEIGHTVAVPGGLPCACGGNGCLETIASGKAIARDARMGIQEGRSDLLRDLTKGSANAVTAQDVAVAAGMGDPFSIGLLDAAGSAVGIALANAAAVLDPSLIVLGGGLAAARSPYLHALATSWERHLMPALRAEMKLVVSGLGVDGSARGIALMAAQSMVEQGTAAAS